MARMVWNANEVSSPVWAGDYGTRDHLLPGGAKIDPASVTANAAGKKYVRSGSLLGRTAAERDAGAAFGLWVTGDADVYLLWQDVDDATTNNDVDLYRHGSLVKVNFLPTAVAAEITEIRSRYQVTTGVR